MPFRSTYVHLDGISANNHCIHGSQIGGGGRSAVAEACIGGYVRRHVRDRAKLGRPVQDTKGVASVQEHEDPNGGDTAAHPLVVLVNDCFAGSVHAQSELQGY